jgi:hypothetical protein
MHSDDHDRPANRRKPTTGAKAFVVRVVDTLLLAGVCVGLYWWAGTGDRMSALIELMRVNN